MNSDNNSNKISREELEDRIPNTRTAVRIAEEMLANDMKPGVKPIEGNSVVKKNN